MRGRREGRENESDFSNEIKGSMIFYWRLFLTNVSKRTLEITFNVISHRLYSVDVYTAMMSHIWTFVDLFDLRF